MAANLNVNRSFRLLVVLIAIVLTMCIFASYYSQSDENLVLPTVAHMQAFYGDDQQPQQLLLENSGINNKMHRNITDTFFTNNTSNSVEKMNEKSNRLLSESVNLSKSNIMVFIPHNFGDSSRNTANATEEKLIKNETKAVLKTNEKVSLNSTAGTNRNSTATTTTESAGARGVINKKSPVKSTPNKKWNVTNLDPTKGVKTAYLYVPGHQPFDALTPPLCPEHGAGKRLIITITSAPVHREARLAIRQTWGHYGRRRDIAIAFVLGRSVNRTIESYLDDEQFMYGDLIRGNFIDSYNNLTLKTISTLEWIDVNCPLAKYILKTDDDMFINVPKLLQLIDKHKSDKRVIFGRLAKKWKPIRNKKSKYYVSQGQFSQTIFPPFTTGPAYLMTADCVRDLYRSSLEHMYLKLEDVFTTGVVAQSLNIRRQHVNEFLNRRIAFNACNVRKSISLHMIKVNEQFDLWKKFLDPTTVCP